ncbi:hypothetical protein [Halorubrum lipolyticum]|uniref:Uncharacterized protein n=1 Tax=Halorubrum lipolyticum DSM 21995 TaxID=1227482 RepID=M0NH57_9EURY|nr:hypothetical protein [Halorubrum lipolyticum]EMA57181.1 hypothetical protein C469_15653 [Halorubrum lipolyticum DSM 21995]
MSAPGRGGQTTVAERFGASIEVAGPDPEAEGFFFVKRAETVDHEAFVTGLLGLVGTTGRLVLHHRSGFAIVRLPHGRARRLGQLPWIDAVGGVRFDPERFAAMTGAPVT